MPRVRAEGAGGGFGEVAGAGNGPWPQLGPHLTGGPRPGARPFRERSGAGLGEL
jgi:hypothetical protein